MKLQANGHMTFNDYLMMYMAKWKRIAVLVLVVWIIVTYYVISPLRCNGASETLEFEDQLRVVTAQLEALKVKYHNIVQKIIKQYPENTDLSNIDVGSLLGVGEGPTEEYENLRRRIFSNTKEIWYYINHELSKNLYQSNKDNVPAIIQQVEARKRSLISDQMKLEELDGHHEWRQREAANVSDLIQRRLKHLQNPEDCRDARKVVCNLNKGCGFGCQLHNIVYCLIFAYATERTLILNSRGWRYNNRGWEDVFHPISETCTTYDDKPVQWPSDAAAPIHLELDDDSDQIVRASVEDDIPAPSADAFKTTHDARVISLPFIDSMMQKPKFLPLAIPKDLAHRITRFNGDPASWWIGQIVKYVLRPQSALKKTIADTMDAMDFRNPIVGVHIRRTDKVGTEAASHAVAEYMAHVRAYYDTLELTRPVDARRVYLATDDATVLAEARKEYPEYVFLGDPSIARTAATHRRYTPASLTGLLVDLTALAASDFLVCTFSSQVGRVAYEMMQANRVDASESFASLDDIYYFGGQNAHDRVAVMPHQGDSDIDLRVGDLIGIAGNHWNGYGRGTNKRTNSVGRLPWYKTAEHLVLYEFPVYKQVPIYEDTRPAKI